MSRDWPQDCPKCGWSPYHDDPPRGMDVGRALQAHRDGACQPGKTGGHTLPWHL